MPVVASKRSDELQLCKAGRAVINRTSSSVVLRKGNLNEFASPDPELTDWHMIALDLGLPGAYISAYDNTTSNDPCVIRFKLEAPGRITYLLSWSTPDQNTPHVGTGTISNALHRGLTYDITYSWSYEGDPQSEWSEVVGTIFIPLIGGPPQYGQKD